MRLVARFIVFFHFVVTNEEKKKRKCLSFDVSHRQQTDNVLWVQCFRSLKKSENNHAIKQK